MTTLAASLWTSAFAAAMFLLVACVGQGSLIVLRSLTHGHSELGQRLRRLAMLQNGTGRELTALEEASLAERVWSTKESAVPEPYYSSELARGPKRLIDITAECAFFSGSIARAAWRAFFAASIVASCVLLITLILLIFIGVAQSRLEMIAKAALVGVTFWMTEDLMDIALRYRATGTSCDHVLQECSRLIDQASPSLEDAYIVFHQYDAAVSNSPPLPARIYGKRNRRLTEIWSKTHPRTIAAHLGSSV